MKKYLVGIFTGLILTCGVVFAIDLLIDSSSVSYESEYTDKINVKDALDELLGNNRIASNDSIILKPYIMPIMTSSSQDGVVVSPNDAYGIFDDNVDSTWGKGKDLYVSEINSGSYTVYLTLPKKLFLSSFKMECYEWNQYGLYRPSNTSIYGKLDNGSYKQICSSSTLSSVCSGVSIVNNVLDNQFSEYKIVFTSSHQHMVVDELRLNLYEVL